MKIKYTVDFKRILVMNVNNKGKIEQMRVGEVELFQQNLDGTLDIVAKIWPQTPPSLVKQIEANPGIMGMNSETLPVKGHLIYPDTEKFEVIEDPEALTMEKLLKRIEDLEIQAISITPINTDPGNCEHEYISGLDNSAQCRKCGYRP